MGSYSHANTLGGRTKTADCRKPLSLKKRKQILVELREDRERYIERLDCALGENDAEGIAKFGKWVNDCNAAIDLHEQAIQEADKQAAKVRRIIKKRIARFAALAANCEREIDRAAYQTLITNEQNALRHYRAAGVQA